MAVFFSVASREESVSLPFPVYRSHWHSLDHGSLYPSSKPEVLHLSDYSSIISPFDLPILLPSVIYLKILTHIWKIHLPCKVIYSQVSVIRLWKGHLGGRYFACHNERHCKMLTSNEIISFNYYAIYFCI